MDLMVICQGCLAQDRSLKTLGGFELLFEAVFRHSYDVFQMGFNTSDLLFCWECLQIIKNIHKFHSKVVEAQLALNNLIKEHSHNNYLEALSSLTSTVIPQNANFTAGRELESLKNNCIYIFMKEDRKGKQLKLPETSVENSKQKESHNIPKYESIYVNTVEDFNEETDCDKNYDEQENITEITIEPDNEINEKTDYDKNYNEQENITEIAIEPDDEIKEKEQPNMTLRKRKPKQAEQEKTAKRTCKSQVSTKASAKKEASEYRLSRYRMSKNKRIYRILNLLNVVPGSLDEDVLERLKDKENFKCTKCNEVCYNETDFTSHMKSHFQKYMCRLCGDDLTYDEDNIYKHVVFSKHKKTYAKIQCSQRNCKMKFISVEERDIHSNECGIYKCNDCTEVFKCKRNLRTHCRKHMTFKCIDCNVEYTIYNSYSQHRHLKHNKQTEAAYCVQCDIRFDSDLLMRQHLMTSMKHKQHRNSYPCSECSKVFNTAKTRKKHFDHTHVGITEYHCQPCNKYFFSKSNLNQHKKITHDKVPLPKDKLCPHCGRGFRRNELLNNHIYTHTGERPYQCSYCDAKFVKKVSWNMHMKNIHKHGINTRSTTSPSVNWFSLL